MLSDFPEYIRSAVHGIVSVYLRFRSISVHSLPGFSFLCAGKLTRNSTVMAGTTKDMSLIDVYKRQMPYYDKGGLIMTNGICSVVRKE